MTYKPVRIQPYREVIPAPESLPAASHGLCMDPDCMTCWAWLSTFPDVQAAPGELPPQIVSIKLDAATYGALMAAAGRDARIEDVARDALRAWAEEGGKNGWDTSTPRRPDRMTQTLAGQIGGLKEQVANVQRDRNAAIGESPAASQRYRRGSR